MPPEANTTTTTAPADWRAGLPDDLKGAPALKDVKDLPSLAKGYVEAQSMIGSSVRIPSKEAGEDGRKAFRGRILEIGKDYGIVAAPAAEEDDTPFFSALGRPAKSVEYKLPEGVKPEGDILHVLEAAHAANMTQRQFDRLYNKFQATVSGQEQVRKQAYEKDQATLKAKWGEAHDTRRGELATMLETHGAPPDLQAAYKGNKMTAASILWLYDTLSAIGGEGTDLGSQGKKTGGKLTPDEANARLLEVEARLDKLPPGDPEYQQLVNRRLELIAAANPE